MKVRERGEETYPACGVPVLTKELYLGAGTGEDA
jgi:hypothetical protein